jgi:Tubulin like
MSSKLFVICIGGSGAKCFEAITQLAAAGLYNEQSIEVLFVDPDEANGSMERARRSLNTYQQCQRLMGGDQRQTNVPWMQTPIKSYDLWSPFADQPFNRELSSFFQYNSIKNDSPSLANFFDVLYSPEERLQQLDEGFRGRPSIGAAVMSQINLDQLDKAPWGSIIQEIKNATGGGNNPRVLLCGSIFGGTGASGIPTIARLLSNKFEKEGIRKSVRLGGLFLLPYFSFTVPPGANTNGIYASADQFLLNTEAALRYYVTQASSLFDTVYLLGNEDTAKVDFSVGKKTQSNRPHFIELYAALAARDFLLQDRQDALMLVARAAGGVLNWDDLPDGAVVRRGLVNAARTAYLWLSDIQGELEAIRTSPGNLPPWAKPFYDAKDPVFRLDADSQQNEIKIINSWSADYLRWLRDVHQCDTDQVRFFNHQMFSTKEKLSELVIDDPRDPKSKQRQDGIPWIKEELRRQKSTDNRRGGVGLATSLYLNTNI